MRKIALVAALSALTFAASAAQPKWLAPTWYVRSYNPEESLFAISRTRPSVVPSWSFAPGERAPAPDDQSDDACLAVPSRAMAEFIANALNTGWDQRDLHR